MVILFVAIGMLLPSLTKSKASASRIALAQKDRELENSILAYRDKFQNQRAAVQANHSELENAHSSLPAESSSEMGVGLSDSTGDKLFIARYGLETRRNSGIQPARQQVVLVENKVEKPATSPSASKIFLPKQDGSKSVVNTDNSLFFGVKPASVAFDSVGVGLGETKQRSKEVAAKALPQIQSSPPFLSP